MRFARAYLRFIGAMGLFFGFFYLLAPTALTDPTGFGPLGANALTDVRATYGGFQIGSGLFLLWAAADAARVSVALVLQALTIGAIASCRLTGIAIDGSPNGVLISALAFEVACTALALFALRRLPNDPVGA
jgi:Domain of unknown function (DUF4345)